VKKTALRQYVFLPSSNRGTQFCDCKIEGRETVTFERLKLLNGRAWFFNELAVWKKPKPDAAVAWV